MKDKQDESKSSQDKSQEQAPHSQERRDFARKVIQAALATSLLPNAVSSSADTPVRSSIADEYDFIIVGSGAGGGPLAANLARKSFKVLLLEAGDDDNTSPERDIPAFHTFASEDEKLSWEYFVKHYEDIEQQEKDSKYIVGEGVLYPRGSTIGGSTAVNALITVYPHHNDFDRIADITQDDSWRSEYMRKYFQRLERCQYLPSPPFTENESEHGFDGWLPTRIPDLKQLLEEPKFLKIIKAALIKYGLLDVLEDLFRGEFTLDVNHIDVAAGKEGAFISPLNANRMSKRHGVREYLLETAREFPDNLHILTNALATKILFEQTRSPLRATGVQFQYGKNLYKADRLHEGDSGQEMQAYAKHEVIVSAGAFNSPQLLKLSGIGPAEELSQHGIETLIDLPGVGENLQDRYELGVVSKMKEDIQFTASCEWGDGDDPCMTRYERMWWSRGPYASNGPTLSIIKRSKPELEDPDLFLFGLPAEFAGYYPGYSQSVADYADRFTWVVLKAHTNNTAGRVLLKSADPQDTPDINFHYFHEGNAPDNDDLLAVVEGVKLSRDIMRIPVAKNLLQEEMIPGSAYQSDEQIAEFVKNEAWGHHASCTNKMGAPVDPMAVVDSKFRVFGTEGLRIVDASVFPYIPGFFIAVPIFMISEKATDDIVEAALNRVFV